MWQWGLKYCQVCAWMMQGGGDCWLTDGGTTGWGWEFDWSHGMNINISENESKDKIIDKKGKKERIVHSYKF